MPALTALPAVHAANALKTPAPAARTHTPPGEVRITPATRSDLDALVALEQDSFVLDRISRRSWRRLLSSRSASIFVARPAPAPGGTVGAIAGAAVVLQRANSSVYRLYSIAVHQDLRRQGLAERLLARAMQHTQASGGSVLRLETRADNLAAQQLFKRLGFVPQDRVAKYYEDGADALRLQAELRPSAQAANGSHQQTQPPSSSRKDFEVAPDHLIIVEKLADFRWLDAAGACVVTAEEFISQAAPDAGTRSRSRTRKVINLCRSYDYLSLGYYCSLLAEARGDRVTPTVETILDLQQRHSQQVSLARLDRLIAGLDEVPRSVNTLSFHVFFGHIEDTALSELAHKAFELYRCPLLEIELERPHGTSGWKTTAVRALDPRQVDSARDAVFLRALEEFTRRRWSPALAHAAPKMDLAILHDPEDPLPPSNLATLQHIVEVAQSMNIAAELIRKKDYSRLTQFDALLIRETTAVNHHTFKFAQKAAAAGMPVIDDPGAILHCTNKAFLAELLRERGIATPRTRLVSRRTLARFESSLSYPVVLKVPDGSFSRDVKKAQDFVEFQSIARTMFKDSEIVLVQDFMYTAYDWRVGVLNGQALFVARYHMVRDHWQIIRHVDGGTSTEGHTEAVALKDTPAAVLDTAIRAARLIGDGFYGVDLKQTPAGVFVIEVNDNPNLDVGAEDQALGDELYRRLLGHLLSKFERGDASPPQTMASLARPALPANICPIR